MKMKKSNKKMIIGGAIVVVVVGFILWYAFSCHRCGKFDYSQDVIDKCNQIRLCTPDELCMDGFGDVCYFDNTQYDKEVLQESITDMSLPQEIKDICFANNQYSVCTCDNEFALKIDDELTEVSCEEYYQAIEDKNLECNNCLETVEAGCC